MSNSLASTKVKEGGGRRCCRHQSRDFPAAHGEDHGEAGIHSPATHREDHMGPDIHTVVCGRPHTGEGNDE